MPKMVKAMTFKEVLAKVKKKADEEAKLPPEEQEKLRKERQAAIADYYAKGGTAVGFAIGTGKEEK